MNKPSVRSVIKVMLMLVWCVAFLFLSWHYFEKSKVLGKEVEIMQSQIESEQQQLLKLTMENAQRNMDNSQQLYWASVQGAKPEVIRELWEKGQDLKSRKENQISLTESLTKTVETLTREISILRNQRDSYRMYGWACAIIGIFLPIGYIAFQRAVSRYSAVES
ncbi:MAG: hypothetical protein AB7U82_00985 [Blastocatellales bacterium]